MKVALTILTLILLGCSQADVKGLPVAPPPTFPPPVSPGSSQTWLWGMAVHASGVCIDGATAAVVRGQRLGQRVEQRTPCDAWAYDGGFIFKDLTPGVEMTLRVSAPGFTMQEKTVIPFGGPQTAVLFVLSPTQ
jgi:hypothetical protein